MEEGFLIKEREEERVEMRWGVIKEEVKRLGVLAGPMVAVTLSQFSLQVMSLMMVGHLGGELSLSSAAMATSLTNVTGFSLLMGMASALETLCGQAFGAKQYNAVGMHLCSAIISLIMVAVPLSFIWIVMGNILILIGQDPLISFEAGKYAVWMIPALFAYAILQALMKFLQTQSLVLPMLLSTFVVLCFHIPACWILVFKSGMGKDGAAVAIGLSYWLNVLILGLYVKYSPSCERTRVSFSKDVFQGIGKFFRLAIPSAVMICLEWWSYELLVLLSGLLPNPELETSVLSICLTTISTLYAIPYGIGAAGSTRVSNELGAGKPHAARLAVFVVVSLAIIETIITSVTLLCLRRIWGYAYSNEKEVVDYVTNMGYLVCISIIMDSIQGVLSGIARGSGWQHIGAYVNLGSFYLVGIPVAAVLAFVFHVGGRGLWIGILSGAAVQSTLLSLITGFTNWEKQAQYARDRVFANSMGTDGLLK